MSASCPCGFPIESAPLRQVKGLPGEKELLVRVLDVPSLSWSVLQPSSAAPPARGGHSVRAACPAV